MAKAHLQDLDNYKKGTCWTTSRISSELDNEFAGSFKELSFKTERIDDHGLGNDISILRRKMAPLVLVCDECRNSCSLKN